MDAESARAYLLTLPHVEETLQWGNNLVFWVGDKALGGKMFALIDLDHQGGPVLSFAEEAEHAVELCEKEGFRPAPYLARAHWVAAERWDVLTNRSWEQQFCAAHAVVSGKLPAKTRQWLDLPGKERRALILERRKLTSELKKDDTAPKASRKKIGQKLQSSW